MYFPDLTPYEYCVVEGDAPAFNVGWLDAAHEFTKGTPPPSFLDGLRRLLRNRVKQTRGFHFCPFCPEIFPRSKAGVLSEQDQALYRKCLEDGRLSSSEVRVTAHGGRTYAAPAMVLHYVEAHQYLPPAEFIEAVIQSVSLESDETS